MGARRHLVMVLPWTGTRIVIPSPSRSKHEEDDCNRQFEDTIKFMTFLRYSIIDM